MPETREKAQFYNPHATSFSIYNTPRLQRRAHKRKTTAHNLGVKISQKFSRPPLRVYIRLNYESPRQKSSKSSRENFQQRSLRKGSRGDANHTRALTPRVAPRCQPQEHVNLLHALILLSVEIL